MTYFFVLLTIDNINRKFDHCSDVVLISGCLTCCCAPISNLLLAEKLGLEGFEYKYLSLIDYLGTGGICTFISTMLMRGVVRERYNIEGSAGEDCICAFCCTSCAICQMTNQVDETVE